MLGQWVFAPNKWSTVMLLGGAWIAKKILHALYAKAVLKKAITQDIECYLREMWVGVVIVVTQKLGIPIIFVQITKDMSKHLNKS